MIRLYLLALAIGASATRLSRRDTSCTPGPITANDRQCTIECGTDHAGGDYSALPVSDFQACIDACTADPKCNTAQYLTTNSYCYLKDSLKPASSTDIVNGIVCQVQSSSSSTTSTTSTTAAATATCTPGSITINGRSGTVECDTDRAGGDFSSVNVQTFQDCENACAADTTCLTAQYDIGSHYCYLKSSTNDPVQKTGVWGVVFGATVSSSTTTTTAASTTSSTTSSTTTSTTSSTTSSSTSSSTTSTTTYASSTTPYASGCTATATASPYATNGGFEAGFSYDYSNPRGVPVNFVQAVNRDYGAAEGCNALNVYPITYHRPVTPVYSLQMRTFNLQDKTRYSLSFFMGGYSSFQTATAMQAYYSIGDSSGSAYACGTNTYPSICHDVSTTGAAKGQYIQMNFTYTSDKPQALNFVVYWQGLSNPVWLLDDIEIKAI